jgi:hypothetical protein
VTVSKEFTADLGPLEPLAVLGVSCRHGFQQQAVLLLRPGYFFTVPKEIEEVKLKHDGAFVEEDSGDELEVDVIFVERGSGSR